MPAKKMQIEGAREMSAVLRELPDDLAKNALVSANLAGARELQRVSYAHLAVALRSRSPREDDVTVQRRRSPRGAVQVVHDVGPPKRKPQLRWLHDGTRGRQIQPSTRRALHIPQLAVTVDSADHPGQPPRPWLRSAVFASRRSVLEATGKSLRRAIPRQVKKLVSRKYRGRQVRGIRRGIRRRIL